METVDSIGLAASLGVCDVELLLQTPSEYKASYFARARKVAEQSSVTIHAVHVFQALHPFQDPYKPKVREARTLFEQAVHGAASLGARILVWHGLCGPPDSETIGQMALVASDLAGLCNEHGVILSIENVSWCRIAQTRDVLGLTALLAGLPNEAAIGYTFDPFQAAEAGANPFMVLAAMEARLKNVHLRDFDSARPTMRTLSPGRGELPWPALIRAIHGSGYVGPLMLEGSLLPQPAMELRRIRDLIDPLISDCFSVSDECERLPPAGFVRGIELFNEGKFYECHEEIEHEWHAERGEIRRLYQGILQIGVGYHHAQAGNRRGATLLLSDGIAKIAEFPQGCMGIDLANLRSQAEVFLAQIESSETLSVATSQRPAIRLG
ncbi:hypothetical protein BH23CHL5_BH23CHL5_11990 [soil metagenome]